MLSNININSNNILNNQPLLTVENLVVKFTINQSFFSKKKFLNAVSNISFNLNSKETLGIVGESGCGKSTLIRAILRLLPDENIFSGKVIWNNKNIMNFNKKELKFMRKDIGIVFQDPLASLNPRMNILEIISEPILIHYPKIKKAELINNVKEVMSLVGLDYNLMYRYPHEFSGGQSQRIGIARAIILKPKLIVCDEAVSALDVSIKAQIINLLQKLKNELNVAFLFISHDLSIVEYISDRVMVLYLGKIMELAKSEDIYKNPLHPYTKALIASVPVPDPIIESTKERVEIPGEPLSPFSIITGCPFASRCNLVYDKCLNEQPILKDIQGRLVACHRVTYN